MATTGILRAANVVFYHPLDDFVESAVGQTWTGTAAFATGKIPLSSPLGVSGATGSSFSFGSIKTVSAVTNTTDTFTVAASIDSTRALLWYRAAPSTMGLRVATVSGTDITLGAETTVASLDTHGSYSLTKLTAAKFVASAILGFGTVTNAVVATVSGTAVTVGAKTPVRSAVGGSTTWPGGSVVALTSSTVLATWSFTNQSSNAIAQAAIGTVSGSDITFGATKDLFTSASVVFSDNVAVALSSTTVVSAFMRAGPKNLVSVVITVSGSDITVGSLNTVETTNSQFFKFGICALDSTRIAVSSADASGVGRVRVGSVSGTTISYGSSVGLIPDIGVGIATQPHCYKLDTDKIIVCSRHANTVSASVEVFTVSGLALTSQGNSLFDGLGGVGRDVTAAIMSTSKVVFGTGNTVGTTAAVGELGLAAGLTAPTPAAYPSTIGDTRVVICFWARNATAGTTSLDIERGYKATLDATSISLGGTTAVWSGAGITTLMSTLNDGSDHFLVMDFENTSGTTWRLRTSVDGAAFVDQGTQTSGTQAVTTTDTAPNITVGTAFGGSQYFDEMVMWSGDKATFDIFTTQELANLNDLANIFGEPMNQFEENFGAPLCWQATARMPDGSVWRDSGSGRCPSVVRVPRGAEDVVVTDDGTPASPRIIEG